ncbi:MAG: hypothetical protein QOG04_1667 [Actinomycetota bacterium]|jgi:hypothetical protein|nr:hypothetical protein [Actinomycetota bacterium]
MKKSVLFVALALAASLLPSAAHAQFAPKFTVSLSDTKALGHPEMTFHLEFANDDEEIGNFIGYIPKGFDIASDEAIPTVTDPAGREKGEVIGSGNIVIAAGPGCHPSVPVKEAKAPLTVPATFYERTRTDEEADSGVHAVWFLDIEPANRVRLLVTGSKATGWKIEGAPTPSDATCNALTVDLTINSASESGVPIITNAKKPGAKKFMADIVSQDSPAIAHFEQMITITK